MKISDRNFYCPILSQLRILLFALNMCFFFCKLKIFSFIFKKYIGTFDDFDGEYEGLKKTLNDGLANMQKDYDTATAKKN